MNNGGMCRVLLDIWIFHSKRGEKMEEEEKKSDWRHYRLEWVLIHTINSGSKTVLD
jgi:hypothetical protein